jgi:hypothetical protein
MLQLCSGTELVPFGIESAMKLKYQGVSMTQFGSSLDPEGLVTKTKGKVLPDPFPSSEEGAVSAVTGGLPEDINQMPPDIDPKDEETNYDGSDISKG